MDLTPYKQHQHAALLRVLATLFAAVGLVAGGMLTAVPWHLRLSVLRQLRSLESAARRLLVAEAQGMDVEPPTKRSDSESKTKKKRTKGARKASFPMVEPLQSTDQKSRRSPSGPGPRMFCFDGTDPPFEAAPGPPSPDDLVDAEALCRRLLAVQSVLADMSRYARRLALWQARRAAEPSRSGRTRPLRPGRPPGHRERPSYEIDAVLSECHALALRTSRGTGYVLNFQDDLSLKFLPHDVREMCLHARCVHSV